MKKRIVIKVEDKTQQSDKDADFGNQLNEHAANVIAARNTMLKYIERQDDLDGKDDVISDIRKIADIYDKALKKITSRFGRK